MSSRTGNDSSLLAFHRIDSHVNKSRKIPIELAAARLISLASYTMEIGGGAGSARRFVPCSLVTTTVRHTRVTFRGDENRASVREHNNRKTFPRKRCAAEGAEMVGARNGNGGVGKAGEVGDR